jgi:hypothetical protein
MVTLEIGTLGPTAFLEADDGVFRENAEIPTDLSLVALDAPGEVADRFDLLAAKYVDEFAALLGQDAFGALVAEDVYPRHPIFGEGTSHLFPALSTRDLFRTGSCLAALVSDCFGHDFPYCCVFPTTV